MGVADFDKTFQDFFSWSSWSLPSNKYLYPDRKNFIRTFQFRLHGLWAMGVDDFDGISYFS